MPWNKARWGTAKRSVTPERLDHLAPDHPLAITSRRDLRRVHRAMRSVGILKNAVLDLGLESPPRRILELGAGDGSLLLRLARTMQPHWAGVQLTLLDRQNLLPLPRIEAFAQLGWDVTVVCMDALEWAQSAPTQNYDLCLTTLFLHHFDGTELRRLLAGIATGANAFIACEPQRSQFARLGSQLIGLLGANEVTREDSVKSVAAGFNGLELTEIWSTLPGEWRIDEYGAWPFTHCFCAARANTRAEDLRHER